MPTRLVASAAVSLGGTGVATFTFFRVARTENVNTLTFYTGSTPAADDPTVVQYGLYSEDPTTYGITRLAQSTNDAPTTMLTGASGTPFAKTLDATVGLVAGSRYAVGLLVVSAATMPTTHGIALSAGALVTPEHPRMASQIGGMTSMPASVADGAIANRGSLIYAKLTLV